MVQLVALWANNEFYECGVFIKCVFAKAYKDEGNACDNCATNSENCPTTLKKSFQDFSIALMTASDVEYAACKSRRNPVSQVVKALIRIVDSESVVVVFGEETSKLGWYVIVIARLVFNKMHTLQETRGREAPEGECNVCIISIINQAITIIYLQLPWQPLGDISFSS